MTISRVNALGWAGDRLTTAQINALDENTTYALDKRDGETDTLESVVSCSGAGRLIPSYAVGADEDTTYELANGISVINATGNTAARTYTLATTGAVAGDTVLVFGGDYDVTVKVSSTTLLVLGAGNTGLNQSRWGEFIYTGSTWMLLRSSYGPEQRRQVFTEDGTYTVPADCWKLMVIGLGGGGGGGGGSSSVVADNTKFARSGGGGGGAILSSVYVNTSPGATFDVTVADTGGAGGSGGSSGAGSAGQDGGNAIFGTAIVFRGAQGGEGGIAAAVGHNGTLGGGPVAGLVRPAAIESVAGQGGRGGTYTDGESTSSTTGMFSIVSCPLAGDAPTSGGLSANESGHNDDGAYLKGHPGGGGGASALGSGGNGGSGGGGRQTGQTGVPAYPGSPGGTGAGGGGGGAAGQHESGGTPSGGAGGKGGDGAIIVIPIR